MKISEIQIGKISIPLKKPFKTALRRVDSAEDIIVKVIADSGDPSSIALHKKLGFDEAGRLRQVGHKHGRDIDTVLLQCSLD